MIRIDDARQRGRVYCDTEGSEHYRIGEIEPIEYIISQDYIEGFALANIIKYASRYQTSRNLDDLKKVADYAHILCGTELIRRDKK